MHNKEKKNGVSLQQKKYNYEQIYHSAFEWDFYKYFSNFRGFMSVQRKVLLQSRFPRPSRAINAFVATAALKSKEML